MATLTEEDRKELQALILGFLQQSVNQHPLGMTLRIFDREFPEKSDEPPDWYKRYKCPNSLEALKLVPQAAKLGKDLYGEWTVELNRASKLHDVHLTNMVENQRGKSKSKSRGRPRITANRGYSSRYTSTYSHRRPGYAVQRQQADLRALNQATPPPPVQHPIVKTQMQQTIHSNPVPPSSHQVVHQKQQQQQQQQQPPPPPQSRPPLPIQQIKTQPKVEKPPTTKGPRESVEAKEWLRQRIVDLFTRISSEIRLVFLPTIYQNEYDEPLDSKEYGYTGLVALFDDPILSKEIEVHHKQPYITISSRIKLRPEGKENRVNGRAIDHLDTPKSGIVLSNVYDSVGNLRVSSESSFEAIDPFNLKSMQQSLQKPFVPLKEKKIEIIPIDDDVKYKTFRMIMTSDSPLEIEQWQNNFEFQTKLSIKVSAYGFNNCEDFFRELAKEMPIKIERNIHGRLVASMTSAQHVAEWLNVKMSKNEFKSIYVLCDKYELIANPKDRFTFRRISQERMMKSGEFHPVIICSAKNPSSIWLRVNYEHILLDLFNLESSMCAYSDYTNFNPKTKSSILPGLPRFFVKEGLPCSFFDQHLNRWCRAIIMSIIEPTQPNQEVDLLEVNLLLVDYGLERKNVAVKQLNCLLKDHMKTPVIPIQCHLSYILPPLNKTTNLRIWSGNTKVILQEYVNPPSVLACKFINEESNEEISSDAYLPTNSWGVELCDTRTQEDRYLHQSLIEAGFAESI